MAGTVRVVSRDLFMRGRFESVGRFGSIDRA